MFEQHPAFECLDPLRNPCRHPARRSSRCWPLGVIVLASASLLLCVAAPARAESTKGSSKQPKILRDWSKQLVEADRLLREGEGRRAYKLTSRLLGQMTDRISSGPEVGRVLGTATILRAIAAYQLGREHEALWHWQVAIQMFPEAEDFPIDGFGEAGSFLKDRSSPWADSRPSQPGGEVEPTYNMAFGKIEKPRKKHAPQPQYPAAKRQGKRVSIVVQGIIGKDGRVHQPHVLQSQGELTLVCASLDALRRWKFEPARLDGEPIDVYYNLAVNFNP